MQMTPEEIVRHYTHAANKHKDIKVLAELNMVTPAEIRAVLAESGVEGIEAPKRIARRKKPSALPPPEKEAPPSAAPEPPQENGPEVYQKIENILAALPGDMGQKARWAAEKMVAEVAHTSPRESAAVASITLDWMRFPSLRLKTAIHSFTATDRSRIITDTL